MKAEDLANELLKNPDFDVNFVFSEPDDSEWGLSYHTYSDIEIGDVGYSDKVIILCGKEGSRWISKKTKGETVMDTQGWEITKLRAENEWLKDENKWMKEELTKKPEWTEQDYVDRLQAENKLLNEIITITDTRYELSERIRVAQDEQIARLKDLLREAIEIVGANYGNAISMHIGFVGWPKKAKKEVGEDTEC